MSDICVCGHDLAEHHRNACDDYNCPCTMFDACLPALAEAQEIMTALCEEFGLFYGPRSTPELDRAESWLHSRGVKLSYEKGGSK
jgi:hypothetical protein